MHIRVGDCLIFADRQHRARRIESVSQLFVIQGLEYSMRICKPSGVSRVSKHSSQLHSWFVINPYCLPESRNDIAPQVDIRKELRLLGRISNGIRRQMQVYDQSLITRG